MANGKPENPTIWPPMEQDNKVSSLTGALAWALAWIISHIVKLAVIIETKEGVSEATGRARQIPETISRCKEDVSVDCENNGLRKVLLANRWDTPRSTSVQNLDPGLLLTRPSQIARAPRIRKQSRL